MLSLKISDISKRELVPKSLAHLVVRKAVWFVFMEQQAREHSNLASCKLLSVMTPGLKKNWLSAQNRKNIGNGQRIKQHHLLSCFMQGMMKDFSSLIKRNRKAKAGMKQYHQ